MLGRKNRDTKGIDRDTGKSWQGNPVNAESTVYFFHRFYVPQSKRKGKTKDLFYQNARDKVIIFSNTQSIK